MKFKYYVALVYSRSMCWVTDVNNATKTAKWEHGKRAKEFGMHAAENLVFGLCANGYPAMVVKAPDFMVPANLGEEVEDNDL